MMVLVKNDKVPFRVFPVPFGLLRGTFRVGRLV